MFICAKCSRKLPKILRVFESHGNRVEEICKKCYAGIPIEVEVKPVEKDEETKILKKPTVAKKATVKKTKKKVSKKGSKK